MADLVNEKKEEKEVVEETAPAGEEAKPVEEVKEEVVKEEVREEAASPSTSAQYFLKEIEDLRKKVLDLEGKNEELQRRKAEADAKQRLDIAMGQGWLTPAMLQEEEGKDSVFVYLAKKHPELFDRLHLVMAPKAIRKPDPMTNAPVSGDNGNAELSDDEKFNKINALAKEKGISYADAAKDFIR